MNSILVRTIVPILLLIGAGFFSRKMGFLRSGDERVLSAYVYYFALPALFFVNIVETSFVQEETLKFMLAGIVPVFVALPIFLFLYVLVRFPKNILYLLMISTIFGSLAFFGIPFVTFAFATEGERLGTLAAASISPVSVTTSITLLELYKLEKSTMWEGLKRVLKRLSKNPLILAILSGMIISLVGAELPLPISTSLHMLGGTTSTVAIFMLGVFLYGRRYTNIASAFGLSLLRMVFLPIVAFFTTLLFDLPSLERSTLILIHGMPIAISMIVLSERYDFHKETIASLILISSLGAGLYLNLWLLFLGYE
ncbi:MAG: AEC family transporter [Candidatus Bathyarchaeota archaeon]|nr:MAG: AEC family transporter [Candidatus Bathyarchaeota archaeon]